MKKLSAILCTTTALIGATSAYADAPGMNDPFFWIGEEPGAPEQSEVYESAVSGTMQRESFTDMHKGEPIPETHGAKMPANPVLDDYPVEDSPAASRPRAGNSVLPNDGCSYPTQSPATMEFGTPKRTTGQHGITPEDRRRGEMGGDDGVLSAIQDNPCSDIMRRGGETANSAQKYLREGDIRRANTLEDRRIPTHSVGRYAPEGSGLWHRDPSNPFIDAASEWDVRSGETLSQLLHRWADDAGYTIVYQANTDFVIQADVIIRGTFAEATGQVVESFANANPPIAAEYFFGNKVIVVRSASDFDGR